MPVKRHCVSVCYADLKAASVSESLEVQSELGLPV